MSKKHGELGELDQDLGRPEPVSIEHSDINSEELRRYQEMNALGGGDESGSGFDRRRNPKEDIRDKW